MRRRRDQPRWRRPAYPPASADHRTVLAPVRYPEYIYICVCIKELNLPYYHTRVIPNVHTGTKPTLHTTRAMPTLHIKAMQSGGGGL